MEGLRLAADLLKPVLLAAEQERDANEEAAALRRQERQRREAAQQQALQRAAAESELLSCEPAEADRIGNAAETSAEAEMGIDAARPGVSWEEEGEAGGGEEAHADEDADDCLSDGGDPPAEGGDAHVQAGSSTPQQLAALKRLLVRIGTGTPNFKCQSVVVIFASRASPEHPPKGFF